MKKGKVSIYPEREIEKKRGGRKGMVRERGDREKWR